MRAGVLAVLIACGGGHGAPPDASSRADAAAASDAPGDGATKLMLANGGVQLIVSGSNTGFQITPADLATDSDAIEIHQEYYGVPWDEFAAGQPPPAAWKATMDAIAASAHAAGKPIFLSVSMLDGTRTTLAPKPGGVENWAAHCYDFGSDALYAPAYQAYVAWMIDEFQPTWLDDAIEVNLFFEACPSAATALVTMANATYAAIKAKQPSILAFPSFQIDHLYGVASGSCTGSDQAACFDANYAVIAPMKRDRFAMSSYPIQLGGMSVATLPQDWFTRGAARAHETPLIAETGTNDTPIVIDDPANGCVTAVPGSDGDAAAYLARVLADGAAANMDVVNWWSDRDLVDATVMTDCPCTYDANWCGALDVFRGSNAATEDTGELVFKAFGTMGLRDYAGNPKPFYAAWQAAR